ncbi:glycosyltransferase family 9 protein, partial [Desulfovibrio sp. OttesenSCG-928-I05]|nr:glycosyltransferase family 9 protein [Desulfovibrio sp. OttesenSCG-928-I05]
VNSNAWAAFMQGASRVRGVSPFNVADLFRKVAEGDGSFLPLPAEPGAPDPTLAPPSANAVDAVRRLLELPEQQGVTGYVALQAGASEERRRWPAEHFAALGERLWREEGLCPVLLGSSAEKDLVTRVAGLMDAPSVNLAGKTSLGELGAVLQACRLLVSNDTGTLHLASGLGMPVLGIFLATAQPWDTGPFRAGNCSLEPDMECHPCAFGKECPRDEACRRAVGMETVAGLALHFVRTGQWGGAASYAGVRAWESCLDEDGFMGLRSLSGHDAEDRSRWLDEQRRLYRQFLDRDQSAVFSPVMPNVPLGLSAPVAEALRKDLYAAVTLLDALIQQGQLLLVKPLPQIKERFFASFTRIGVLLQESPHLAALRLMWMEDTSGSEDLDRALRLAGQYHALLSCCMQRVAQ